MMAACLLLHPGLAQAAVPNGTWLSRPQIWFHTSTNTLSQIMERIRGQRYRIGLPGLPQCIRCGTATGQSRSAKPPFNSNCLGAIAAVSLPNSPAVNA